MFEALRVEGSILNLDHLGLLVGDDISSVDGQKPQDFGETRLDIARVWDIARHQWHIFTKSLEAVQNGTINESAVSITRKRFVHPLLELLGYGDLKYLQAQTKVGDRSYPLTHRPTRCTIPIIITSCETVLDEKSQGQRMTAHGTMQDYLNHAEDLYGLVSNGYVLRLLRDSNKIASLSFVEFNLKAIFERDLYADFRLMYRLLHASRMPGFNNAEADNCWIEKYHRQGIEEGSRIRKSLSLAARSAIKALANGLLSHPENEPLRQFISGEYPELLEDEDYIDLQEFYLRLRRFLYRLFFLLVAEERDLLFRPLSDEKKHAEDADSASDSPATQSDDSTNAKTNTQREEFRKLVRANYYQFYSMRSFREKVLRTTKLDEDHQDLWQTLIMAFEMFANSKTAKALEIDPLDGELFEYDDLPFRVQVASAKQMRREMDDYDPDFVMEVLDMNPDEYERMLDEEYGELDDDEDEDSDEEGQDDGDQEPVYDWQEQEEDEISTSDITWLKKQRMTNGALLRALRHLSTFVDENGETKNINYRYIDVEELGSVYEGLLELRPTLEPMDAEEPWPDAFDFADGMSRKLSGSYYTRGDLVGLLVKNALEPVIAERLRALGTSATIKQKEEALLSITVCDPSCGSGHILLAAARRLAHELAFVRSGEREVTPSSFRLAMRQVITSCIYGVDLNPDAVELCKVSLWLESHVPGTPISYLDHKIRCGNSLVGVWDTDVLQKGIPEAAYKARTGDSKDVAKYWRERNKNMTIELTVQTDIPVSPSDLLEKRSLFARAEQNSLEERRSIRWEHGKVFGDEKAKLLKELCDIWCAAWFWPYWHGLLKVPTSVAFFEHAHGTRIHPEILDFAKSFSNQFHFFHWPLEFPEVFANGGFDVMMGNPPWEQIELSKEEFFSTRKPVIAQAKNDAKRRELIEQEASSKSSLWEEYQRACHDVMAHSNFAKGSERFTLTGKGRLNLYSLFSELFVSTINEQGRVAFIVPSGIVSDDGNKFFFQHLVESGRLRAIFDFENRKGLFPQVDSRQRFCVLGVGMPQKEERKPEAKAKQESSDGDKALATLSFYLTDPQQVGDDQRTFQLSTEDFLRLNPNTRTCPTFRTKPDAELTKKIYARVPVLWNEEDKINGNPWGVRFKQGLFNMATGSDHFAEAPHPDHLPLYEAKLIHQFDHRFSTYVDKAEASGRVSLAAVSDGDQADDTEEPDDKKATVKTVNVSDMEHADPSFEVRPRYWVPRDAVEERLGRSGRQLDVGAGWDRQWLMGWRDIARSTDIRTCIATVIPRVAVGNNAPLCFVQDFALCPMLLANFNSMIFDYVTRQKVGGTHLTFGYLKQIATLPPSVYSEAQRDYITSRVVELVYTSHAMEPFARDMGYTGPFYGWNPERRRLLRAQLDALYAKLYGLSREDLVYILDPAAVYGPDFPGETFRVLKSNEMKLYGAIDVRPEWGFHKAYKQTYAYMMLVLEQWDKGEMP